jgi:putative membrane protein
MSEPTSREDSAVGPPEHLHPLFLLTGLGGSLRGIAGGYVAIGYLAVSGRWGTAFFGLLALIAFMTIGIFLFWRRFEFRVGANEIRIDSGILSRTHRSIPFDRVQDVDITQGPIARVLGLARVKFETGASGGEEEGVLQAILLERAEQLRELVRSRRVRSVTAAVQTPEAVEEAEPIYALSLKRLFLAGTFNFSLALLAGLFGLSRHHVTIILSGVRR